MISILAIIASVLSLGASVWYAIDLFRGTVRPNLSSWAVWSFITILSSASYFAASADVFKSLLAFSNSGATLVTFGLMLWSGRFSRITRIDIGAALIGVGAGLVWFLTRSPAWGNVIIQGAAVVGAIPTYRNVWANPVGEQAVPWLLWGGSFVLASGVVLLRWTGHSLELVYPLVGMMLYGGVGVVALRGRQNRPKAVL